MIEHDEEDQDNIVEQEPEDTGPDDHERALYHYMMRPRRLSELSDEELQKLDDDGFYFD